MIDLLITVFANRVNVCGMKAAQVSELIGSGLYLPMCLYSGVFTLVRASKKR